MWLKILPISQKITRIYLPLIGTSIFNNFSAATNSNYSAADFDDIKYMVTSVPTPTTLTITMDNNETGSGATTSGSVKYYQYYQIHSWLAQ